MVRSLNLNQAARLAPAAARLITRPASSLRRASASSGPVKCGRAGRRRVRCGGPHEAALLEYPRRRAFTSLRHVGDRRFSPGPPLRPAGCRARLNRRPNHGSRCAWCRAAGRRDPLPLVGLRLRSRSLPAARSARPGARGDRAARLRLLSRAVTDQTRPAKTPARTPSLCSSLAASALRRRPFRL